MYLEESIDAFAEYLMANADKWNNVLWVIGQHSNHVEECTELRRANDTHLQAELLDKAIIAAVLVKLGVAMPSDDLQELADDLSVNGVVEYMDVRDLVEKRQEKFISKINL